MKKLQLFQLLFLFIILKLSEEMDPRNEQNITFTNFAGNQGASGSSASWQQPSQHPKIQTLKEYSKNKNLPLTINQRGGNFPHNSILSGNAANEQFLDTTPQNITSSSIHDTYLQNTGMFID